jgi:DNA-binding response OmpR family regulator/anti-anti-sigma regulatory factor
MAEASKKNVRIIEDDISLSGNLSLFLSKKNFNALVSLTGKEALISCFKQPPDLIICDIQLPDMSGFSVIRELKTNKSTKSIPFIFLSGNGDSTEVQKGLNLGAVEYITKPVKINSLLEIIYTSLSESGEEKQTILVIEDDANIRDNLYALFSRNGYNVLTASNGQEGLEKAFSSHPDIVICDIMLPDFDGYSVLEKLAGNDKTQTIPFIYLTAKSDLDDFRKGMSLGPDDYITKPFKAEDLLNSVKKRLNKFSNIKKLSNTPGSRLEGQHKVNDENPVDEKNFKKIFTRRNYDVESSSAHQPENINIIVDVLENKEPVNLQNISGEAASEPSIRLPAPVYDDKNFEYFLENRNESLDYQSYCYGNVFVILVNLHIAVQKEAILFYNFLQNAFENGNLKIVIDMTKIEIIDSTFVGVLISCKRLISENGGKLKLVMIMNKQFSNTMIQQSMEKNFEIYLDLKTAIQSY